MKYTILPVFLIGVSLTGQMNTVQISPQVDKKPAKLMTTSVHKATPLVGKIRQ